jgi:hypothetical protein
MDYDSNIADKRSKLFLPVQTLDWERFNIKNLRRILFQFEVEPGPDGEKTFSLVAYCAIRKDGKWKLREKIKLEKSGDKMPVQLDIPITLGNLELRRKDIKKLRKSESKTFTLTPKLFSENPHVSYTVSDGTDDLATLNPSPPDPPARSWE